MHPHHFAVYGPYGISQTLLGQWLGLRQPQVSRFETGPALQMLDTLQHWARVLRIPPELLWFRLPENTTPPAVTEPAGNGFAVRRPTGLLVPAGAARGCRLGYQVLRCRRHRATCGAGTKLVV